MNRQSTKGRARADRAREWREHYATIAIGRCDLCEYGDTTILCCHEIVRCGVRKYVLTEPAVLLVVCWGTRNCHAVVDGWPKAAQLALLRLRRGEVFERENCLERYNRWALSRLAADDLDDALDFVLSEVAHA